MRNRTSDLRIPRFDALPLSHRLSRITLETQLKIVATYQNWVPRPYQDNWRISNIKPIRTQFFNPIVFLRHVRTTVWRQNKTKESVNIIYQKHRLKFWIQIRLRDRRISFCFFPAFFRKAKASARLSCLTRSSRRVTLSSHFPLTPLKKPKKWRLPAGQINHIFFYLCSEHFNDYWSLKEARNKCIWPTALGGNVLCML